MAGTSQPTDVIIQAGQVAGEDAPVLTMNRSASKALRVEHRLEIIPGATHLFEEPGALDTVARLACDWFVRHLSATPPRVDARLHNQLGKASGEP